TIIRNLLTGRLATWASGQSPKLQIGLQNAPFTPPRDAQGRIATHLMSFVLPADTESEDYAGDHRRYHGIWQINIVTRAGTGPKTAEDLVAAMDALYPVNLRLTSAGRVLLIRTPITQHQPIVDDDRYTLPVDCRYEMHTI